MLLHTKFAAVTHADVGQFLHVTENWVKFLKLQEVTLRLILSKQERQNLNSEKNRIKKEHQTEAFQLIKYITL